MIIHYLEIITCLVISMVLGSLWFGPIFGKRWMAIIGANKDAAQTEIDQTRREEMQKAAMPLYFVQALLTLVQIFVLDQFIQVIARASGMNGLQVAVWTFLAFIMPAVAAASMWTADTSSVKWGRFLIQGGYYVLLFIIFGAILGMAN